MRESTSLDRERVRKVIRDFGWAGARFTYADVWERVAKRNGPSAPMTRVHLTVRQMVEQGWLERAETGQSRPILFRWNPTRGVPFLRAAGIQHDGAPGPRTEK